MSLNNAAMCRRFKQACAAGDVRQVQTGLNGRPARQVQADLNGGRCAAGSNGPEWQAMHGRFRQA